MHKTRRRPGLYGLWVRLGLAALSSGMLFTLLTAGPDISRAFLQVSVAVLGLVVAGFVVDTFMLLELKARAAKRRKDVFK